MNNNILENYNLTTATVEELSKGYTCNKWVVNLDERKYLLKEMQECDVRRIEFINLIQEKISSYNLAPKILKTIDGNDFVVNNGRFYIMYEFINGSNFKKELLTELDIFSMGKLLGKIHHILDNFNYNKENKYLAKSLSMREPNIDKIKHYIFQYNHKKNILESNKALEILNFKLKFLNQVKYEDIDKIFTKYNNSIVHGDFYIDNLLLTNNGIVCVDFDQTCLFPLSYEFYRAVSMICYDENFDDYKILNNINLFMFGYISEHSISNSELLDGLELFIYITNNSLYCLSLGDDITYAEYKYKMVKWITKNKDKIAKNIMEVKSEKANTNISFSVQKRT